MNTEILVYKDFTLGYKCDPGILKDNELNKIINMIPSENGGFTTRNGTQKVNESSFNSEVTDCFPWVVSGSTRKIIIKDKKLCWLKDDGSLVEKQTLHDSIVGFLQHQKKLYIGDGTEIYVWGDFDFAQSQGTVGVDDNDIVKAKDGHFYRAKSSHGSTNLETEDFTDTSDWEDVTDIKDVISDVVRPIKPYESSVAEVVELTITKGVKQAGSIKIKLDDKETSVRVNGIREELEFSFSSSVNSTGSISLVIDDSVYNIQVFNGESSSQLAERISGYPFEGYKTAYSSSKVTFIANECGKKGVHSFDDGHTGIKCSITKVNTGSADSAKEVAEKIENKSFEGWKVSRSKEKLTFTAKTKEMKENMVFDSNETGVVGAVNVVKEGKDNDCDLVNIKKCKMFVKSPENFRIFASGNPDDRTAVYFSEPNSFEHFKKTNIVYPIANEKEVRGMRVFLDHVMVSYDNNWYHWKGLDPKEDAIWKPLPIPYGAINNDCICGTPLSMSWFSERGFFVMDIGLLYEDALVINNNKLLNNLSENRFSSLVKSIKKPNMAKMTYFDDKIMLAYCDDESLDYNNKVLVYNWNTKGVCIFDGWRVNQWMIADNDELLFASENYLLKTGRGYTDIDVDSGEEKAIVIDVETKNYNLGNDFGNKFVHDVFLDSKQHNKLESTINVSVIIDYKRIRFTDVSLVDSLIWGRRWGLKWGFIDNIVKKMQVNKAGMSCRVKIHDDTLDNPVTIYGIGFHTRQLPPHVNTTMDERRLFE